MDKQLNRDQFQAILDSRPKGVPLQSAIDMYVKNGWVIEGINEPEPTVAEQIGANLKERGEKVLNTAGRSDVTFGEKVLRNAGNAVATIGDVAAPVIGAGLKATGLDKPLGQAVGAISQTAPAQAIGEAYGNLSERTQENLGAVGNVASAIPLAKAGQVAVQGVKTGAKATVTAGSELLAKRAATKAVQEAKQIDNLAGTIVQGTPQDIAKAKKAIASIDIEGVKTYKDLVGAFDEKIKNLSDGLDEVLTTKPEPKLLEDLKVMAKVGEGTVTHNYVKDALIQLEDLYTKTNNVVAREQISQLAIKANREGLTIKEVNDLARLHGKDLNAFNANGQAASGLTKQAAENTRTGLKATARDLFNDPLYKEADTEISTLIRTRDLVDNVAVKVNQLQQRIQERGLGAKVGVALGRVINTLGLGTPKGIVEALIPRGQGFKVMNALDLEKALSGNLKKLQDAVGGKTETDILNKLNNLLQESKVNLMTKSTATINKNNPINPKPNTIKKKVNYERAKDLSPENRLIEDKAFAKIDADEEGILSAYKKKFGNEVNTDNFRPLFKDEGYNGANAAAVQEPSSHLAKKAYTDALKNKGEYATFSAGGSGAGKSSGIKAISELSELKNKSAVILDSNLSSYSSAIEKIKEAQKAGKKFEGIYTYRDPVDSLINGVIKRMKDNPEEMGRIVPTKIIADNHIKSLETVKKLIGEGYNFRIVDNSLGQGKAKLTTLQDIESKAKYPSVEELTDILNKKVKELYEKGKLTAEQYREYVK